MERAGASGDAPAPSAWTDADWGKSQVGVGVVVERGDAVHMPLDRLAKRAKVGVRDAGGFPLEFMNHRDRPTGISMGPRKACAGPSLSREIILPTRSSASCTRNDSTALGDVRGLANKSLPGMLMAAARLNLPVGVPLRAASILPGRLQGPGARRRQRVSRPSGRAAGGHAERERAGRDREARVPDRGFRARGMFTANTMGVDRRSDRHVPFRAVRRAPGGRPSPRRLRLRERPCRHGDCSSSTFGRGRS